MKEHWKSIMHQYVNLRNRMSLNDPDADVSSWLIDTAYLAKQSKWLQALKKHQAARGEVPLQNETRLRIVRVEETASQAVVLLAYKQKTTYILQEIEHTCVKMEQERLTFIYKNDSWLIRHIEQIVPEKNSASLWATKPEAVKPTSSPYLNEVIVPRSVKRSIAYNRTKVQQYADKWWDGANPDFIHFDVDCTNYVSQCLYAGNAPMNYTGERAKGWWYRGSSGHENWSFSWSVAHSLQWYLTSSKSHMRADQVASAAELTVGDVIIYDWDGDGKYQHSTIVTAIDASGMPLVNAHTSASFHRPWAYRDSYAWSEQTKYRFFHIHDTF